jgi:hypothetical protein
MKTDIGLHFRFLLSSRHGPYSIVDGNKEGVWNQYTGDGILQRVRSIVVTRPAR